jgi:hypothetical protein
MRFFGGTVEWASCREIAVKTEGSTPSESTKSYATKLVLIPESSSSSTPFCTLDPKGSGDKRTGLTRILQTLSYSPDTLCWRAFRSSPTKKVCTVGYRLWSYNG